MDNFAPSKIVNPKTRLTPPDTRFSPASVHAGIFWKSSSTQLASLVPHYIFLISQGHKFNTSYEGYRQGYFWTVLFKITQG